MLSANPRSTAPRARRVLVAVDNPEPPAPVHDVQHPAEDRDDHGGDVHGD